MTRRHGATSALVLTLATLGAADAIAATPDPSSGPSATASSDIAVTARVGGDPCGWDGECGVRIALAPTAGGAPAFEAAFDASRSDPDATVGGAVPPGTYDVMAFALWTGTEDADGKPTDGPREIARCGRTLDIAPDQSSLAITASMAWGQPACGIIFDPPPTPMPRPFLADPIRPKGPPPRFRPIGRPTAQATRNGVRFQLWVKDRTLRQGQWLLAHLRVTNVSRRSIPYNGRFEDLACPPVGWGIDTRDLFDPGKTWDGVAGRFKERFLDEGHLVTTDLAIPKLVHRGSCGDVGFAGTMPPGMVVDIPLVGMPSYAIEDRPLPPGTMTLNSTFSGKGPGGAFRIPLDVDIVLAGDPVTYPSPGQLVDAALETPGFIETLELAPSAKDWANSAASPSRTTSRFRQPRFDGARTAQHGIIEIMQFLTGSVFVAGAILDPWTGESYGAYGW
jgi:hypothetical protein